MNILHPTETVRETRNRYGRQALAAAVIFGVLALLLGQKAVAKGLVLGALFSVANFAVMAHMLPAHLSKSRSRTFFAALLSLGGRYALMAVPLIVTLRWDQFSLPATVTGLFMVQLAILAEHAFKAFTARKFKAI